MQLIISSRKLDITPDVRAYVEEKMGKITDYYNRTISVRAELSREEKRDDGQTYACELLISIPGKQFRIDQRGKELFEAIDLAESAAQSQIKSFKEKMIDDARQNNVELPAEPIISEEPTPHYEDLEYAYEFKQEPMSMDEAIEQMNLLGHDFYVFTNKDTGENNTVYKKSDGRYGVIVEKR